MYVDPGAGSLFVQVLLTALATILYRFRKALTAVFFRNQRSGPESNS